MSMCTSVKVALMNFVLMQQGYTIGVGESELQAPEVPGGVKIDVADVHSDGNSSILSCNASSSKFAYHILRSC